MVGSEQGGIRPVLIVQNNVGNRFSPTVIAAAITSRQSKAKLPTHIELPSAYGLAKDSVILLEQIRTLEEQNMSLASVIKERDTTIAELQEKHPTWAQIRVTLQPFTVALIEETARRLSEKYGRTIAPMSILTDMFLRYTIERWNEWFYKFCLNDREILAIAQEINPDIKSINQVKKAVCK